MTNSITKFGKSLVVATGGFVFLGDPEHDTSGKYVWIKNCRVIRKWGTTDKGLHWLAAYGPTSETVAELEVDSVMMMEQQLITITPLTEEATKAWENYEAPGDE